MLPPKMPASADQQRLLSLYRQMSKSGQRSLLDFAAFLVQREDAAAETTGGDAAPVREPLDVPRPADETVIAAIRRLSQTFPMLDKDGILHEASALMTAHVMRGKPSAEVIDELEAVFRRHYERVKSTPE
jgi:hypothetical protein